MSGTELTIIVQALGGSVAFGLVVACIADVLMNPKLKCFIKGEHVKFYYAGNSDPKWWMEGTTADGRKQYQCEHVYWCGRCGYESSDEKDQRERERKREERRLLYENTIWERTGLRGPL